MNDTAKVLCECASDRLPIGIWPSRNAVCQYASNDQPHALTVAFFLTSLVASHSGTTASEAHIGRVVSKTHRSRNGSFLDCVYGLPDAMPIKHP